MSLKLYNTLTRKKEEFKPLHGKEVGIYTCGPTVYDLSHVGHARTYISFDILVRYLKYLGYKVNYVINVTDVDDKIIARAQEEKIDAKKFTDEMTYKFIEDFDSLGIEKPDVMAKVTENVPEIVSFIEKLIEEGYAYESDGDVYFSVRKFKDYGKLSGNDIEGLESGARIEPGEKKEDPLDFALWKKAKEGETISFESPWGEGRPGWHIECSALAGKYVGETLDIHGGGNDLVFPHHEDEVAQSEAANDKQFARNWVHTGMVTVDGKKMSKSLGNFITIRDILKKYPKEVLRLHVLEAHYRSPIDFNDRGLENSQKSLRGLKDFMTRLDGVDGKENSRFEEILEDLKKDFLSAMDDDINTPKALATIFDFIKKANKLIERNEVSRKNIQTAKDLLENADDIFGLGLGTAEKIPKDVQKLTQNREKARKEQNWAESDKLRDKIIKLGYTVEDTSKGPVIKKL